MHYRYTLNNGIQKFETKTQLSAKTILLTLISLGLASIVPMVASAASGGSPASGWHTGYYTPSNRTLSLAETPSASNAVATLNFTNQANTALLVTDQKAKNPSILGDLTGMSVSATATVSGVNSGAKFIFGGPNDCGTNTSYVRYYFQTSNAGGFNYTHYWWSHYVHVDLTGNGSVNLDTVPFEGSNWSDWNGQLGNTQPDGFSSAVSNVTEIGLSFGGDCFYENGVGTTDGSGVFTLNSFDVH